MYIKSLFQLILVTCELELSSYQEVTLHIMTVMFKLLLHLNVIDNSVNV